ncbi:MAG: hypothetical protein ACE5GX_14080 [Thermoanaerobaculia bacterium]
MNAVFRKLQFKDQSSILVSKAPSEFKGALDEMKGLTRIVTRSGKSRHPFVLCFVRNCAELAKAAPSAVASVEDDGLLWFAYPKKSSKRYESDIGRDDSWQPLGDLGYEGVRMIAIDEDWSALRLRRVEFIKTMKRDPKRAMTAKGKKRTRR